MAVDRAELRALRKALRLSQQQMADLFQVQRSTYANWESPSGMQSMPEHFEPTYRKLIQTATLPSTVVLGPPSIPVTFPPQRMPYAGYLPAGDWSDPLDSEVFEDVEAAHWKQNRFCARIAGDSCHPALQREDFTIWESTKNPPFGKIVVAQRKEDHAATVKVLEWDPSSNSPKLKPINMAFEHVEADGWSAVAMLVYVRWEEIEGGHMSLYRPEGIRPSQLIRARS